MWYVFFVSLFLINWDVLHACFIILFEIILCRLVNTSHSFYKNSMRQALRWVKYALEVMQFFKIIISNSVNDQLTFSEQCT